MSKRADTDRATLARMLKALAHPNRLRLFDEIRGAGHGRLASGHACFLNQIIDAVKIGAPTVSHHLKELVDAGLVTTEKQGKYVLCRVNPASVDRLARFFAGAARSDR
jgi:DNA-binding transcriptional ArsR family regulator